ncbi:MAG: multifunctional CCA addition/repair protein [Gammaproteobacteria bacterium]|nr:multifunctional CCA addition/repair protein [Gammaproteobacteria bacterium]MCF6363925.1 multifunctional CCA addition/repair protein [Gammaproteobacteria bacterium]
METFLVGGAVRDKLLGLTPKERDWVVVGATVEAMTARGYRLVGKDFPVFLHPESHEEYALARTERKTAPGYHGFSVHAAPDVTLEQDLLRRDLTVNAIAETADGELVDPFGGQRDLRDRILRHVSPAFVEDPVRILRVARFAARFTHLGFRIADETMQLMREMVEAGEIDALVAERVWAETERALRTDSPAHYFEVLRDCGALARLLPEVDRLFGVPQPEKHHPEIDTGVHTMLVLTQAARLSPEPVVRFAALVHDLGKGTTPKEEWPRHIAHETRGLPLVKALCKRLRIPNHFRDLALLVTEFHLHYHRAAELRPETLLKLLRRTDALRRPKRFEQFILACEADSRGRWGFEDAYFEQPDILRRVRDAAAAVDSRELCEQGLTGKALGEALQVRQLKAIRAVQQATAD